MDGSNDQSNNHQYCFSDSTGSSLLTSAIASSLSNGTDSQSTSATLKALRKENNFSTNARRLGLRNAGFRAALIPARRLSPPTKTEYADADENAGDLRFSSFGSNSSSTILKEIRNSSRQQRISCTPIQDPFVYADDEREETGHGQQDTMLFKTGSLKSKSRKRAKRVSSFQSGKYIEYLESELGAATERLDTLQSPETVRIQALKIRKLEKQIQELSQHLTDWEQNYEERVNDQVFERLHGESDLRLKINNLEEAAAHKEAHIAELGKELEDAKTRLVDSESVEVTLSKRVDVLTELLAKSPTRMTFSSNLSETPLLQRSNKFVLPRFSSSPTREQYVAQGLETILRLDKSIPSVTSTPGDLDEVRSEHILESDSESFDFDRSSRPASGIFSSRSSQANSSRPASIFSASSLATQSTFDDKSSARPRRSRRFGPGTTTLKPLILPTTAGLPVLRDAVKQEDHDGGYVSPWGSSDEQITSTPNRPQSKRPYSWAHNPPLPRQKSILEGDESEEDTFIAEHRYVDNVPEYLRHFASEPLESPSHLYKQRAQSTPPQTGLSLHEELDLEHSFASGGYDTSSAVQSPCPKHKVLGSADSSSIALEKCTISGGDSSGDVDDSVLLKFPNILPQPSALQLNGNGSQPLAARSLVLPALQGSYLRKLVTTLRQKPINLARQILLQSWTRGAGHIAGLGWWVMGLILLPRRDQDISPPSTAPGTGSLDQRWNLEAYNSKGARSSKSQAVSVELTPRSGLARLLPQIQKLLFSGSKQHPKQYRCPHCVEPPGKRSMRFWTKFALALVVAVGYALIDGPEAVLGNATGASDEVQVVAEDDVTADNARNDQL